MTVIYVLVLFFILVFPHELGHFIAARTSGVKVNEFSLGMGPAIYKKEGGETLYSIRLLPIGGFCAMEGEDEESTDKRAFCNASPGNKFKILVAGAFVNILIAMILFSVVAITGIPTMKVDSTIKDTPAAAGKILKGDEILAVNGKKLDNFNDFKAEVAKVEKGEKLNISIKRDGSVINKKVPVDVKGSSKIIGIVPGVKKSVTNIVHGPKMTWDMTKIIFKTLGGLFTGSIKASDLSGPVGIIKAVGTASGNGLISFFSIAAFISLNIGIFNLLPFPALDGGRIVFVLLEKLKIRVPQKLETGLNVAGFGLLILLLIFVTYHDIHRIIGS